jgi:trehalose/maltose transport system substrate-binding protein
MRILVRTVLLLCLTLALVALSIVQQPSGVRLTVSCGTGEFFEVCSNRANLFAAETGYRVRIKESPEDKNLHLNYLQALVDSESSALDVYLLDATWVGAISNGLLPLDKPSGFFDVSLENNRLQGVLLALPLTLDVGVLYVRDDLLDKYGYSLPETWQDVATIGEAIAKQENIQPYLFPNDADNYTAQAIEWFTSEGASTIVEPSRYITVQNVPAIRTVASDWFRVLSSAPTLDENATLEFWQDGKAVFMRHWAHYGYRLKDGALQEVRGKIIPLPSGEEGSHAVIGGWQLGVSRFSKHPKEALEFLAFMTRYDTQYKLAEGGFLPARATLYNDKTLQARYPIFALMPDVLSTAVSRPSTVTRRHYQQVSETIQEVLQTSNRPAQETIQVLADELSDIKNGTW